MTDIAIRCEGLSKQYRIGERERYKALRDTITDAMSAPFRRLRAAINGANQTQTNGHNGTFWALKDVSFEIKRGEVVGIIGRNGAGKSTLLKILSRITAPTMGQVEIHGRVGSLLEVGTGFHPELTGRENIYLNGAILGMKRAEIEHKFHEIVAFAEIDKFIDTPVKRYSSGMYVRLAFAVAAHLEPEILVIDEVLAVGDAAFQKKCLGKMGDVANKGRTVLFVSHNMAAVKTLCQRAVLLEQGRIITQGNTEEVISKYLRLSLEKTRSNLAERDDRMGNGKFLWTEVRFLNKEGHTVEEIISGEELIIQASYIAKETIDHQKIIVAISFFDEYRNAVAGFVSDEMGVEFNPVTSEGTISLHIPQVLLRGGMYSLKLLASHYNTAPENFYDSIEDTNILRVIPGDFWGSGKTNRVGSYSLIPARMVN